jgi:hypothetical protein
MLRARIRRTPKATIKTLSNLETELLAVVTALGTASDVERAPALSGGRLKGKAIPQNQQIGLLLFQAEQSALCLALHTIEILDRARLHNAVCECYRQDQPSRSPPINTTRPRGVVREPGLRPGGAGKSRLDRAVTAHRAVACIARESPAS